MKIKFLTFLLVILILMGCQKASKGIPPQKVPKESPAQQEIRQVISKWSGGFKKGDYRLQWNLLSSNSPLRKKFTEYISFPEGTSEIEKNKAAFLVVSEEAFGPFKGYEVYRIVVKENQARAYLVLHWGGHTGMGEAFIRPMRKKLTLELVREGNKWFVFDEKDGFKTLALRAHPREITELVFTKEGSVVEILPNQNRTTFFFRTEVNKLGIVNTKTHKSAFLSLFLGKNGSFLQAEWSPSGEVLGIRYDLGQEPEALLHTVSFFKKNGDHISTKEAVGFFKFTSEESIASIFGEKGSMEIVEYNFVRDATRILWDDKRPQAEDIIPLQILGVSREKIVVKGVRRYEGYELEGSSEVIWTIDKKNKRFQKLTDKWFVFPETHTVKGRWLSFLGGRVKVEADTEVWEEISLVAIDLVSGKEKVIKFMEDVPAEDMEDVSSFSWSPGGNEATFAYGTRGLFLASLRKGEFQGIYPPTLDWGNSRVPTDSPPDEISAEIWAARWSPEGDKTLFVVSPGRVFVSSQERIWESVEVKALSERLDGNQCYWQSEENLVFVGWKKVGEKNKPRAYAVPKGIYTLGVSLK